MLKAIDNIYHSMPVYRSLVVCTDARECSEVARHLAEADYPVTRMPDDLQQRVVVATLHELQEDGRRMRSCCHDSVTSVTSDDDDEDDDEGGEEADTVPWGEFTAVFATCSGLLQDLWAKHGRLLDNVKAALVATG